MFKGRNVESIDRDLRRMVRLAAGIRYEREALTGERRMALKARVLRRLDVSAQPTLGERVIAVLTFVARPAPLLARIAAIAILFAFVGAGATLASAESVPDDSLYGMKLASEAMRLSLARTPEDRAAVELTIAEHRLREATALALRDREAEADAAVSEFGEHLATAAAHLEEVTSSASPSLVEQLRARVVRQQRRIVADAERASASVSSSTAVTVLTVIATSLASADDAAADEIADTAARGAEQAASFADDRLPSTVRAGNAGYGRPTRGRVVLESPAASMSPAALARVETAAKAAKHAAERARKAAERARNSAQSSHRQSSTR